MSTNQQYIDRALTAIKVLEKGQSADATDSATALAVFNQMLHSWGVSDKDFNWFTQDTLADTAPIPNWAEEGVISNLAIRLAEAFETPVSQIVIAKAINGSSLITRTLLNLNVDALDMSHLPQGRRPENDILNDI